MPGNPAAFTIAGRSMRRGQACTTAVGILPGLLTRPDVRSQQGRPTSSEVAPRSRVTLHEYTREWVRRYQGRGRRGFREQTRTDYARQLEQYSCVSHQRQRLTDLHPWISLRSSDGFAIRTSRRVERSPMAPCGTSLHRCVLSGHRSARGTVRVESGARDRSPPPSHLGRRTGHPAADNRATGDVPTSHPSATSAVLRAARGDRLRSPKSSRCSGGTAARRFVSACEVRRRIVRGEVGPPKSKYGRRTTDLVRACPCATERRSASEWHRDEDPVFTSRTGTVLVPGNLFRRVLKPAVEGPARRGPVSIRSVTRAPRCCSLRAGTPCRYNAGSGITPRRSRSRRTCISWTTISERRSISRDHRPMKKRPSRGSGKTMRRGHRRPRRRQ